MPPQHLPQALFGNISLYTSVLGFIWFKTKRCPSFLCFFFPKNFPNVSVSARVYLWLFLLQPFSLSDFLLMPSVAPITVKWPNHFTSLSWWNSVRKMPRKHLTQKQRPRLNTTAALYRAFLVCFWCLALWGDLLLSAFIVNANIYPVFWTVVCLLWRVFVHPSASER